MKKTIMLMICMMVATAVQAKEYWNSTIERQVKDRAERKWPNDFDMQAYNIKSQREAFDKLNAKQCPSRLSWSEFESLQNAARQKWPDDYSMQLYSYEKAVEDYFRVKDFKTPDRMPGSVFEDIRNRAISKWPSDYSMQLYEIEKQASAWMQLNGK